MTAFENFLIRAIEKYGYKYDYSKFKYISMKVEGTIICPIHGEFKQSPRDHLRLIEGCKECKKLIELEKRKFDFFRRANERYNNFFDYSKFNYINAKTKSIIICPIHGEFLQTPDKHLQGINPCPFCEQELKSERTKIKSEKFKKVNSEIHKKDIEDFIKQANLKFGDKFEYDFANYSGVTGNKIRIKCPIHGWFEKVPRNFIISNCGCTECGFRRKNLSKTKSYDSFVLEAKAKHNNKYIYPESNRKTFENRNSIVEIECKKHGLFKKRAIKRLNGQGCFECKIEELVKNGILVGGYNSDLFKSNRDIANKQGYLYYLMVNNGRDFKIGITVNLKKRLKSLESLFDNVVLLKSIQGRLEDMYNIEQEILQRFKFCRIYTKQSTELFSEDISKYSDFNSIFFR